MAAVKRILREARQIQEDPSTEFVGGPLEDNLFVGYILCNCRYHEWLTPYLVPSTNHLEI